MSVTCVAFQLTWQLNPVSSDAAALTASNTEGLQLSGQKQLQLPHLDPHFSFGHAEPLEI